MPAIKSNKLYDRLKFLAQIGLPALGALYFALAGIWGLPGAEQVLGTVLAIDTFLGVILGLSSAKYQADPDGHIAPDGTVSFKEDAVFDKDQLLVKVHRE